MMFKTTKPPFLRHLPPPQNPAPAITSVSPITDRTAGGVSVTITGAWFKSGATVTFGGVVATSVVVVSSSSITANAPAGTGTVDVVVTNPDGSAGRLSNSFTYVSSIITGLLTSSGPASGLNNMVVNGNNFVPGSTITFGGNPATIVTFVGDTLYTCAVPPGTAGQVVDVTITEPGGAFFTLPNAYIYVSTVIVEGSPAPPLDQPTSPNTTSPSGSFSESQAGIRWTPAVRIRSALGNTPNTATYTIGVESTVPRLNTDVSFTFGGVLKFAGTIIGIDSTYDDYARLLYYNVTAVDYTWQLNRYRPQGRYDKKKPSEIIRDLVQRFAPGFSVGYIDTSIDVNGPISLRLDGTSDFASVLTEVCRNAGDAHWKVDYFKNVRAFVDQDPFLPAVTSLVDGLSNPKLWNDPPVRLSVDLSQIRNSVRVVGKGTTSVKNPIKITNIPGTPDYDPTVVSYDWTGFIESVITLSEYDSGLVTFTDVLAGASDGNNYALVDGLKIKYRYVAPFIPTGFSAVSDPAQDTSNGDVSGTPTMILDFGDSETVLNLHKLQIRIPYNAGPNTSGFTYAAYPDGLQILPLVTQQDTLSITEWGVHEFTITDSNLKGYESLLARAKSELAKFSEPIYKLEYTSDDPKNIAGARMRADLAYPMVHKDFVLQEVTLVHDEFGVRYEVVADTAARYDLNDLILDLDKQISPPDVSGMVALAVKQATGQTPTVTGQTIVTVSGTLTPHQVNQLANTPVEVIPAPGAGKVIAPLGAFFYSSVTTPQATSAGPGLVYTGKTTVLTASPVNWNNVTNETDQYLGIVSGSGGQSTATLIENTGISIKGNANGNSDGVGVYKYVIMYVILSRP
jgi:hypothetical protein